MTDPGDTWRRWKQQTFGTDYEIWHDGLQTGGLAGLRDQARARTLEMLRLGLSLGDSHAAEALAAIGATGDADDTAAMRAQMQRALGSERVRLALAIHELRPDPALAGELVGVLSSGLPWSDRIDAAIGLRRFAGAADEAALLAAVADPEYLVRYHACESLLARWGVKPKDIAKHPGIFEKISNKDADRDRLAEARALLERLKRR